MMFFEDMLKDCPTLTYAEAEAVVWDHYPDDFRAYWGLDSATPPEHLDEDLWREYRSLSQLVSRLALGASQLTRPVKTPDDRLALYAWLREESSNLRQAVTQMMEADPALFPRDMWWKVLELLEGVGNPENKRQFMSACMQLEAARLYAERTEEKAERLFMLLTYVMRKPSQRCREYLPRVAECYVRGMDTELAVMARAVLDAALADEYPNLPTLEQRIQHALGTMQFTPEVFDAANRVREKGNGAAHARLEVQIEPDHIMRDLFRCLNALDGGAST